MFVEITKTYAGPHGMFIVGDKRDIPEATLKELPADSYKPAVPPWEEHLDKKAVEKSAAIVKAEAAIKKLEDKQSRLKELSRLTATIGELQKEINRELPTTINLAKKAGIDWPKKGGKTSGEQSRAEANGNA